MVQNFLTPFNTCKKPVFVYVSNLFLARNYLKLASVCIQHLHYYLAVLTLQFLEVSKFTYGFNYKYLLLYGNGPSGKRRYKFKKKRDVTYLTRLLWGPRCIILNLEQNVSLRIII